MTVQCAACQLLREGSLHTANGWICRPCELSASTIVMVYVIGGQRFHKLLKGVQVPAPESSRAAARKGAGE